MKLSYQEYEHICVLTLSGEYTADDVDQFRRSVAERAAAGARHVLLAGCGCATTWASGTGSSG